MAAANPSQRKYRAFDADTAYWEDFEFRADDIIIDAPSKSGTTWTQLLVALLLFDGPEFPAPLSRLSPWMEHRVRSVEETQGMFRRQEHRRFIKSHTPLDGVPARPDVTYVCVGRDPRDAAVSMRHHQANMNRRRFAELMARQQEGEDPRPTRPPVSEEAYFDRWIDDTDPDSEGTVRFTVHHYATFWDRRNLPNVALFHFEDYLRDLPGELMRLAHHLDIALEADRAAELANEASLEKAQGRARDIAPDAHEDVWKDPAAFFRSGSSGEWRERMTDAQQIRYEEVMRASAAPELADWMHHGSLGPS